jgi:hypothetical protein
MRVIIGRSSWIFACPSILRGLGLLRLCIRLCIGTTGECSEAVCEHPLRSWDGPDHDVAQQYWIAADGSGQKWLAVQYDYVREERDAHVRLQRLTPRAGALTAMPGREKQSKKSIRACRI